MSIIDPDILFAKLEAMGEETVRIRLAQGAFAPQRKIDLVRHWLSKKEKERQEIKETSPLRDGTVKINSVNAWKRIHRDYDVTKRGFGRKINFIADPFKRKIIFRDIEQAYVLANSGFAKPAVILAGSVIEELLRIYLSHKGINPIKNTFDGYIKACEDNGLLKSAIRRLTDSIRHFRNLSSMGSGRANLLTLRKNRYKNKHNLPLGVQFWYQNPPFKEITIKWLEQKGIIFRVTSGISRTDVINGNFY